MATKHHVAGRLNPSIRDTVKSKKKISSKHTTTKNQRSHHKNSVQHRGNLRTILMINSMHKRLAAAALVLALFVVGSTSVTNIFVFAATLNDSNGTAVGLGGNCLDDYHNLKKDSNVIQMWGCNKTAAQDWRLYTSDSSIRNANGYCLDVQGASKLEYTYIQLYHCNKTVAQKWTIKDGKNLVNTNTGFCVTVRHAGTTSGTRLWMKNCHGTDAQNWTFHPEATTVPPVTGGGSGGAGGSSGGGQTGGGGSGTPVPTTCSGSQPSGSGITTYDKLTNAAFGTRINSAPSGNKVALGSGVYTFKDFAQTGVGIPTGANITGAGILGAGVDKTIIEMTPNTSTKAGSVPTAIGTTNQLYLMLVTKPGVTLDCFTLTGTNQGHLYNGIRISHVSGGTFSNLKLVGAGPGNYNGPPGETFAINDFHGTNNTYKNIEIDGAGTGASGFGPNSTSGGTWSNSSSHNNKYSAGWAFWEQTNGATITDSTSINNRSGVNLERVTGTVNLTRMTFGGNRTDISGGNDQSSNMQLIITDPVLVGETKLTVNWYRKEATGGELIGKKNIKVIVKGVDKTASMIQWVGVGAG